MIVAEEKDSRPTDPTYYVTEENKNLIINLIKQNNLTGVRLDGNEMRDG